MNETIGEKIALVRKQLGISQEGIALNICTQSEISRIENNKTSPSHDLLVKISKKLGISINYLLEEDNFELRKDYIKEVKEQLEVARRNRDYHLINEMISTEEKTPLFKKGENKRFLMWHKGIVEYHLENDIQTSISTLKSCLIKLDHHKVYSELDLNILNSLGIIFRNNQDLENAKQYLDKAHTIIKNHPYIDNTRTPQKVIYNLSKVYTDLGLLIESKKLCETGIRTCLEKEEMFLFSEFHYQMGRNLLLIGDRNGLKYWEAAKDLLKIQKKSNLSAIIKEEIENYLNNNRIV